MRILGLIATFSLVLVLAACGGGDDDGGSGDDNGNGNGDDSYAQPEGPPPDLASMDGGTAALTPPKGADFPDACAVLTDEMVLELLPDAGDGAEASQPRSTEGQGGAASLCQYAAATAEGDFTGFIGVGFIQALALDPQQAKQSFNDAKNGASGDENFMDYGSDLGEGSLAYYDGQALQVLLGDMRFHVSATGTQPTQDDKALWRDNVAVPVVENMLSRMK